MVCEHLRGLEAELAAAGHVETARGQVWTRNCREFVYFACVLDRESIRARLDLADCVEDTEHLGTHEGSEYGFYCRECQDGVLGYHPARKDGPVFR